jgi:hypothetical protein
MTWIAGLRARLERGDLATLTTVDIGHGNGGMPATHTIRVMLADLDRFEAMDPDEAEDLVNVARRARLLDDFRFLRHFIG